MQILRILGLIFAIVILQIQFSKLRCAGTRALTSKERYYNVKRFGAKGDQKLDDTKAIQAAINKAVTNGGGVVSNVGYDLSQFKTNAPDRVLLLEKATFKDSTVK